LIRTAGEIGILDRMRLAVAFAFLLASALAQGQAPSPDPASLKFEVASIKPSAPGGRGGLARPDPGGLRYRGTNLPKPRNIYALTTNRAGAKLQRHDAANGGEMWIDQAMEAKSVHRCWLGSALQYRVPLRKRCIVRLATDATSGSRDIPRSSRCHCHRQFCRSLQKMPMLVNPTR